MHGTPDHNPAPGFPAQGHPPQPDDAPPPVRVPWSIFHAAGGIAAVILGVVVLLILLFIYEDSFGDISPGIALLVLGGVLGFIQLGASYYLGPWIFKVPISYLGLRLPFPKNPIHIVYIALALGGSLIFMVIYLGVLEVTGWESAQPDQGVTDEIVLKGPGVVATALMVIVIGPFAEEVFFRGFIFSAIFTRFGFRWALIASGIIFAIFHVDPRVIIPIFMTGVMLAWLYHKSSSIWPPFIAHALQNALAFAITL